MNKTIKLGLLMEYNQKNIFLQKSCRKLGTEISSRSLLIYLNGGRASGLRFKPYKMVNYSSRDILNFDFSEKGLGTISPSHFVYDLFKKSVSPVIFS